jgi:predicted AlkP superfamily phosphohydrolase/phosphomutase
MATARGKNGRPTTRAVGATIVAGLVFGALVAALAGCGRESASRSRVILIGIDGMDWQVADPLLAQGKLPNLARIIENGVRRDLRSLEPRMKSPIIWTTIATGKVPDKHGINDFLEDMPGQPLFSSLRWKARSIWDILGEKGHRVGVINWMVGWPALPVNGYWVSDRIGYAREDYFDSMEHVTYPEELRVELAPFVRTVDEISDEDIAYYLNGDAWRTTDDMTLKRGAEGFREIYTVDESIRAVTNHILESDEEFDFLAVYINGLDICCHRYWAQMDPSTVDLMQTDEFIETLSDLIPRYYERIDELIGEFAAGFGDDATVIVCSDHGFRGPFRSRDGLKLGTWMHRPVGVFAAAGPGIGGPREGSEASVMDITPTLLALFRQPVGRDMDGYVLTDVVDEGFLDRNPVTYIDTYETERTEPDTEDPMASPVDEEIKERLRSLGYIE